MERTGEPPQRQARLLEGLGDLYFLNSFEAHPSVERYLRVSALCESTGDLVNAARARSRAGRSLAYPTSGFDYVAAIEYFRAAENVLGAEPESVELGELCASLTHAQFHALLPGPDERRQTFNRLLEISEKLDSDFLRDLLRIWARHLEGHYLGVEGHLAQSLDLMEFTCQTAAALKDRPGAVIQWQEHWHDLLLAYSGPERPPALADSGSFQFARAFSRAGFANMTVNCCGWHSTDLDDPMPAKAKHERICDAQGRFLSPFLIYALFLSADLGTLRRLVDSGSLSPFGEAAIRAPWMLAWG